MHIRYGYDITISCEQATPAILMLDVHPDRRGDLVQPDTPEVTALADGASLSTEPFIDPFGNIARRLLVPAGGARLTAAGMIHDPGFPEVLPLDAAATLPQDLPKEALPFLAGSRYCETDRLMALAWERFGTVPAGGRQVQAVCDLVHGHLRFDYMAARSTRTAAEAWDERTGVCRDFAHLALTLCRCLNIPARYVTGYLGDIGLPAVPEPMDFSAWFEVLLEGRWHAFDARHNRPRIGRTPVARGRDAADVAMISTFGAHRLESFAVITEEVEGDRFPQTAGERRDHWQAMSRFRNAG
ncbi:transglutaminase family protein [Phreatobacter sp.]|uniref:transglutaminase-like domain-containing protein n=1 Tax=Phreatobacter sp. TaxID=1966341 RepID=UPI0022C43499|nr:transglutaminase family protein [Phreatobacter sp.]MCZ8314239.1 transglutaminase family protein [Phreatobacter sp.]